MTPRNDADIPFVSTLQAIGQIFIRATVCVRSLDDSETDKAMTANVPRQMEKVMTTHSKASLTRKTTILLATLCSIGVAGTAFASAPIRGITVKGGKNPGGNYVSQNDIANSPNMPGDPATGDNAQNNASARTDNVNPTSGIGIVIKHGKPDAARDSDTQTDPSMTPASAQRTDNANPNTGIGIVVKKNEAAKQTPYNPDAGGSHAHIAIRVQRVEMNRAAAPKSDSGYDLQQNKTARVKSQQQGSVDTDATAPRSLIHGQRAGFMWQGMSGRVAPATQDMGGDAVTTQDNAINVKGTGTTITDCASVKPAPASGDPRNPKCALKTRTKSNNSNE